MPEFIHAADLHLDSPFKGLTDISEDLLQQVKNSTFISLKTIVDQAIDRVVDFVLFSGDIYDLEDRSIKAQLMFKTQMERLNEAGISVFVLHGNHDFVAKESDHLSLPENVRVFKETVETFYIKTKKEETIAVSGFSYDKKWIEDRKVQHYPKKSSKSDYHIGMLHGYAEGHNADHARYAPFSLGELRDKNYDYWALGHIHVRQQLSSNPLAYYSGNTQGRHRNEAGEKGVLLISLTPHDKNVSFIPTASIIWDNIRLDVSKAKNLEQVISLSKEKLRDYPWNRAIIHMTLEVSDSLSARTLSKLKRNEFRDVLHIIEEDSFVYLSKVKLSIRQAKNTSNSLSDIYRDGWQNAVQSVKSDEGFNDITTELFETSPYATPLEKPNLSVREELVDEAAEMIEYDLSQNEGV